MSPKAFIQAQKQGKSPTPVASAAVQLKCSDCPKKRKLLQRRAVSQSEPAAVPPIVHEVLRTPGQPLDKKTREFMEPRFGHDFSRVRVHMNAQAARSAHAVNAHAYAVGADLVFGAGEFSPETTYGRKLLAHELAHTVQQSSGRDCLSYSKMRISTTKEASEQEADRIAESIASNESKRPLSAYTSFVLQRQSFGNFFGDLNPQCSVDWQAVAEGRFDLKKHLDCCANLPVAGNTCTAAAIKAIMDLLGGGGTIPPIPTFPNPKCPGRETPFGACCPPDQSWNGTYCSERPPSPPRPLCLPPERRTKFGGCCRPDQIIDQQGFPCVFLPTPPQPNPPQPQPPEVLPKEKIEMQFNKDAPQWWYDSASSFRVSLTPEGQAAFEEIMAKMERQPALRTQLEGHASSDKPANDEGYNRRLTDRRVRLIASELKKRGIPRSRLDSPADESTPSGCEEIDNETTRGLLSCSDEGAKVPADPSDRKVIASLFQ